MTAIPHLQKAQPTTLGHYMMAYFEIVLPRHPAFLDCRKRTDVLPLGAGARVRDDLSDRPGDGGGELHMSGITRNSLDSVSDRDFAP